MNILLVLTDAELAKKMIPWAVEIAKHREAELIVANCLPNPVSVPGRKFSWALIENPEEVRKALQETIEALDRKDLEVLEIDDPDPVQSVVDLVKEREIELVYYPVNARLPVHVPVMQFGQNLLHEVPCDVVVTDPCEVEQSTMERLIVPMDMNRSGHALKQVLSVGAGVDKIVPMHIAADIGEDSRKIAETEMDLLLEEAGIDKEDPRVMPRVVMADGFHEGVLQSVRRNDGVLMSGTSIKLMHEIRHTLIGIRPRASDQIAVAIMRPAELAARSFFTRVGRRLTAALPELTLADRVALFDRIQAGARLTPDFSIMIGLSVLIASFGLLADNTSVVIGAMLVAPLMTPLIGAGLALAQGNFPLLKRSVLATCVGLATGLVLSMVLSVLIPVDELPLEVLSRGDPDIVDLVIAFFSGMAAAYAVSRTTVAESI
ncbi:MAG: DUF389 domain-containing protein, partial [Planctomycetota bacterium]